MLVFILFFADNFLPGTWCSSTVLRRGPTGSICRRRAANMIVKRTPGNAKSTTDWRSRAAAKMSAFARRVAGKPPGSALRPAAATWGYPTCRSGRTNGRPRGSRSLTDYQKSIQIAALNSGAEEQELERFGGRYAVLVSIRWHMPTFDPAEAGEPCGPAWLRLKPSLFRAWGPG